MTVDELGDYGVKSMTDEEVTGYLASHSVGVLALPADGAPSMRPLSFAFEGDCLYFLYVVGNGSRKAELTDHADRARFLVYSAETPFNWRSVLLAGTIDEVSDDEETAARDALRGAWRPDVFEQAGDAETVRLYRFDIDERTGLKHLGLPPGFEDG